MSVAAPTISDDEHILLPRWVRLRFDEIRRRHVLLAPERVLYPCATSVMILEKLQTRQVEPGYRFGTLVDELAQAHEAPRDVIAGDVARLLDDLFAQCLLRRQTA